MRTGIGIDIAQVGWYLRSAAAGSAKTSRLAASYIVCSILAPPTRPGAPLAFPIPAIVSPRPSVNIGDEGRKGKPYSWTFNNDMNGDGVPDNWFAGSTPTLLRSSLSAAFSRINTIAGAAAASSAAVTSNRQTSSSEIIYAGYQPRDWTGSVRSCSPTQTAAQCNATPTWDASHWLDSATNSVPAANKLTPSTRKIFTSYRAPTTPFAFSTMRFQWDSLNAAQQATLDTDGNGAARLEFVRGSRASEGSLFRVRPSNLLGDIVNSGVNYVSGPGPALFGANFAGHAIAAE